MIFDIRIQDFRESNEFLKILWCGIEQEFGKCAWQYMPTKNGANNTISFGFLDIGIDLILKVSINYIKKGSIEKLIIEPQDAKSLNDRIVDRINNCVKKALNREVEKYVFTVEVVIRSYNKLLSYEGDNFSIYPSDSTGKSILNFFVEAYDEKQAHLEIVEKMDILIDLLAVDTNQIFTHRIRYKDSPTYNRENLNIINQFVEGNIDDRDKNRLIEIERGKYLLLSEFIFKQIDRLLDKMYMISSEEQKLYLSSKHFHTGLKIYENYIYKGMSKAGPTLDGNSFEEIALTSYLSALEVISTNDQRVKKCKECNQPVYSIKRRVVTKVEEKFPQGSIGASISDYYDVRSKFLHAGHGIIQMEQTGYTIPQLSLDDKTGCKRNFSNVDISIVNYAVRSILINELVEILNVEQG